MRPTRWLIALSCLLLLLGSAGPATADHGGPHTKITDGFAGASVEEHNIEPGTKKGADAGAAPASKPGAPRSAHIVSTDVKGPAKKDKVEVKYVPCDNSMPQCVGTRAGCITKSGNPNNFDLPVITQVSVND